MTVIPQRARLQTLQADLAERFWRDEPIETLIAQMSAGYDAIIRDLFATHLGAADKVALFAVGGYGRAELHPGSDIDLLVLAAKPAKHKRQIELFLQSVFDLNVEVGHSVRDARTCRNEAKQDITVATALFERRYLCGDEALIADLDRAMTRVWPSARFFKAKLDEQVQRHKDYDNVEYNLEPNVKTSPGGLRDIHTMQWICMRQFGTADPARLVELQVLTETEKNWLVEGKRFIWWVRYGLHLVAERKEDRLQLGHQRELAQRLGFVDTDAQRGVERFMHHYYRHVLALTEVNDIVIQHFTEVILAPRRETRQDINERFQLVNNYIEARSDRVFKEHPAALLELFVVMANRNDIAGVRAATIRLVRENLHLIDDNFRAREDNTQLFMDLLKAPYTLVSQLTRMRRYGVLGRYIPEFGRVIGQMQHDLFHIYTVDAHTMMVIRNMRRFRYRASEEAYPVAYHCVHNIPKPELLYLAGLYHDIGKGRGGDHSILGAEDAAEFCERHNLSEADTNLVCWLVKKHLYMSAVSQRQDIYDPDVVHSFASEVKSEMRLDYLYALTVADINATNPTLWNSWRATLLRHLYIECRKMLRRGLESPADRDATVTAYQERALERLLAADAGYDVERCQTLWRDLGDDFFLRHTPPQIAALTREILDHNLAQGAFVCIRDTQGDLPGDGATRVYIYTRDQQQLFAATVVALSSYQLSVVDATVATSSDGVCFDTYTVLDDEGQQLPRDEPYRMRIKSHLEAALDDTSGRIEPPTRRLPRQLREMPRPTEVTLTPTADGSASVMTVLAVDRPGLLAAIALLFVDLDLQLLSAKITTLGERVEDTFVVQTAAGAAIAPGEPTYLLENTIRQHLNRQLGITTGQVVA